jgi:proline-specific peptidase
MDITVDGARLFYLPVGSPRNPPLILLHGGPGLDHSELHPWLDALASDFYLIYVDQRGQGRSERVDPATLSLSRFAADVSALARALDLPRYALLGHSFGAMVAIVHAVEQRDATHYVISGGTASFTKTGAEVEANLAQFEPIALREQVTRSWAMEPTVTTQEQFAELMRLQMPFHFATVESDAYRRFMASDPTVYSPEVLAYFSANEYAMEYEDRLPGVTQPMLVVTGQYDRTCTPRAARDIAARVPGAELVILPDAGHMTHVEQPSLFLAAVRDFFARHP